MKSKNLLVALVAIAAIGASLAMADGVSLEKVKCFMQPTKAAKESASVEWKGAKVFACCENCVKAFNSDKKKHAAKANMQLVATKQFMQQACPFSGGKLDDSTSVSVGAAKVAFCCNNCKGKAEKMTGDEQIESVFGEEAFKKGKFELVKADK